MGDVAAIYGCILSEEDGGLKADAKYYTFDGRVAFASDHFEAEQMEGFGKAVPILENSVLLFNIDESSLKIQEYPLTGAITKRRGEFLYINEVHFHYGEQFVLYCLVLPKEYYPKSFYSGAPHYAGRKGDKIAITWFFKEQTTVEVGISKDADKARSFMYIDKPTFGERHPQLRAFYNEAKDFAATMMSNMIPNGR